MLIDRGYLQSILVVAVTQCNRTLLCKWSIEFQAFFCLLFFLSLAKLNNDFDFLSTLLKFVPMFRRRLHSCSARVHAGSLKCACNLSSSTSRNLLRGKTQRKFLYTIQFSSGCCHANVALLAPSLLRHIASAELHLCNVLSKQSENHHALIVSMIYKIIQQLK